MNNYSFLSGSLFEARAHRFVVDLGVHPFCRGFISAGRAKVDGQIRVLIAAEPELRGKDVVTVPDVTAAFVAMKAS
ncbi:MULTISPECIES: hypothetical protein [unclassified Pseudomonas]|uniref:hypothetical protein n=1 Tax=unclassified Pseudomonas TaxID=196821 RepID=UPI001CC0FF0E|nr:MULTISPECIES: hypothetical protein [unclassified Pseudomonas]